MVAEFLKRTDSWTHVHKKLYRICINSYLLNPELKKKTPFYIFLAYFYKDFSNLICFVLQFRHNSAQNFIKLKSDRAKELSFQRSVWWEVTYHGKIPDHFLSQIICQTSVFNILYLIKKAWIATIGQCQLPQLFPALPPTAWFSGFKFGSKEEKFIQFVLCSAWYNSVALVCVLQ